MLESKQHPLSSHCCRLIPPHPQSWRLWGVTEQISTITKICKIIIRQIFSLARNWWGVGFATERSEQEESSSLAIHSARSTIGLRYEKIEGCEFRAEKRTVSMRVFVFVLGSQFDKNGGNFVIQVNKKSYDLTKRRPREPNYQSAILSTTAAHCSLHY